MMRSFFIWAGLSLLVSVGAIWARWRAPMIDMGRYDTLFEEVAAPSPLHPALIKAVAWQESRFDAEATGPEVSNHAEAEALVRPALARLRSHASKQT